MRLLIFLFILIWTNPFFAQEKNTEEKPLADMMHINFAYGFQIPEADLADRFGASSNLNVGTQYMMGKFIFGAEGELFFSDNIKEDVLAFMRTEDLSIIGNEREYTNVLLGERGWYVGALGGMIIPVFPKARRSGIRLTLGVGFMQHKISIRDQAGEVTQLMGEYKKGYDRLTNGMAVKEFVGYHYFSKNKLINLFAGFEFMQGFTKNRRSFNYDTMMRDDSNRLDLLQGIRIGWTLPFFYDADDKFYY